LTRRIDYSDPSVIADARRQLAEMYAKADRRGRTEIGRKLGYSGKPANIRRSVRRLFRATLSVGDKRIVTSYFKPYVTDEDVYPWKGEIPPFTLDSSPVFDRISKTYVEPGFRIMSYVMLVGSTDTIFTMAGHINSPLTSTNMRALFESYNEEVADTFLHPERFVKNPSRRHVIAIAFSAAGIDALLKLPQFEGLELPREPEALYDIVLRSTRYRFVDDKLQPQTQPTGRPLPSRPKGRQKTVIQYINRAHAQRVK